MPPADLLTRFYTAFQRRDAATMAACYHSDALFSDPVFPRLEGAEIGRMWHMLCTRGTDLQIVFDPPVVEGGVGRVHWEARYTFSGTGRSVHNVVEARFTFRDGLILTHADVFSLHRWAGMALGLKGTLLGWTPGVQNRIRAQGAKALARWEGGGKG